HLVFIFFPSLCFSVLLFLNYFILFYFFFFPVKKTFQLQNFNNVKTLAMDPHARYQSPLTSRYASPEMAANFSDNKRFSTWRKLRSEEHTSELQSRENL